MAKSKKDYAYIAVIDDLTSEQAAQIQGRVAKVKLDVAPDARALGKVGKRDVIADSLRDGVGMIRKSLTGGKH